MSNFILSDARTNKWRGNLQDFNISVAINFYSYGLPSGLDYVFQGGGGKTAKVEFQSEDFFRNIVDADRRLDMNNLSPANFKFVERLFARQIDIPYGSYSAKQLRELKYNLSIAGNLYDWGSNFGNDRLETREVGFVIGSYRIDIDDTAIFHVAPQGISITGFGYHVADDNFDFVSNNVNPVLNATLEFIAGLWKPSGAVYQPVEMSFLGSRSVGVVTSANYRQGFADQASAAPGIPTPSGTAAPQISGPSRAKSEELPVDPIKFTPTDPLTPIYHTPIAPPPSQPNTSTRTTGNSFSSVSSNSNGGHSSRGDYSSGANYSGYSGRLTLPPIEWEDESGNLSNSGITFTNYLYSNGRVVGSKTTGSSTSRDKPVLIDLDGNGLSIDTLMSSSNFLDLGDGYQHRTAWAGKGDGVLVLDADSDGKISGKSEFAFTEWDSSANTDLEALRNVFDTNGNGKLDAGDTHWAGFKVEVDGQLVSLDSLGITSIDLTPTGSGQTFADGSEITGTTTFTRADGSTGTVGDALLAADDQGYIIQRTSSVETDGSSLAEIRGYNTDGSLAFVNSILTSAYGSQVSTKFDDDGNGTVDRSQTVANTVGADGSRSETVSNFRADGSLSDRTTTTRSADGNSISTLLDQDGDGLADQVQSFLRHADGSTTTTTDMLSVNGNLVARTVVASSADGLTKTTSMDQNGDGVFESTSTEITTINADGSRVKTVSVRGADGTLLFTETAAISSDSRTQLTQSDDDGDGDLDTIVDKTIASLTGGALLVETVTRNADGTVRGKVSQTSSADGLSVTTATDITGDGSADIVESDQTIIDAGGARTQTLEQRSADGTLIEKTVVSTSADLATRTISIDADGNGSFDTVETIVVSGGSTVDTLSVYGSDGSTLVARTTSSVSGDGLNQTDLTDLDGDGTTDMKTQSTTVGNPDGSATTTVIQQNGSGTVQISREVTTVSGDGLSTTRNFYRGSSAVAETSQTEITVRNGDGTILRTITVMAGATQTLRTTSLLSADRKSQTVSSYLGANSSPFKVETVIVAADGSRTETATVYSPDGRSLLQKEVVQTSADRLTVSKWTDINGNGVVDGRETATTVLTANGGSIQTVTHYAGSGTTSGNRVDQTTMVASGNGLDKTITTDADGDGVADRVVFDLTTIGSDGSRTRGVSVFNSAGTSLISKSIETVSATGLNTSTQYDLDGDGVIDQTATSNASVLANGTWVETDTLIGAGGVLRQRSVTTTERDGRTGSIQLDLNGDGGFDHVETTTVSANGDEVVTVSEFSPDGMVLVSRQQTTTSANGLTIGIKTDADGDGSYDTWERETVVVNADGSTTTSSLVTTGNGSLRTKKIVKTVSADGLKETTSTYLDADEVADLVTIKTRTVNLDGSITEVVDEISGANNRKYGHSVTTTTADGRNTFQSISDGTPSDVVRTVSDVVSLDGTHTTVEKTPFNVGPKAYDGLTKTTVISADGLSRSVRTERFMPGDTARGDVVSDVKTLNADGTTVETIKQTDLTGTLIDQVVETTSANGLVVQDVVSGQHTYASLSVTTLNGDGSTTTTETIGSSIVAGAITNAANSETVVVSANGRRTDTTVVVGGKTVRVNADVNAVDGSETHSTTLYNGSTAALAYAETIARSADGLTTTVQRDTDGVAGFDQSETTIKGGDGRVTTTFSNFNDDGSLKDRVIEVTSANGLSSTTTFDGDGDGVADRVISDATVINPDGTRTQTVSKYDADGTTLLGRSIIATSADGRTRTTQTQLNGLGITNETQTDISTFDANGNEVIRSATFYADGTKKSGYEITKYRDNHRTFTYFDHNGDGIFDEYQIDISDTAGNKQQSFGFPTGISWRTGLGDASANSYSINESVDGREIEVLIYSPDDPASPGVSQTILGSEQITKSAVLDGSYIWKAINGSTGTVTSAVTHTPSRQA